MKRNRKRYGQGYYGKYAGSVPADGDVKDFNVPFLVRVEIPDLNIRRGSGADTAKMGKLISVGVYTIVKVKDGKGSETRWRRMKSGAGWIALDHAVKI